MELTVRVHLDGAMTARRAADIAERMKRFESRVLLCRQNITVSAKKSAAALDFRARFAYNQAVGRRAFSPRRGEKAFNRFLKERSIESTLCSGRQTACRIRDIRRRRGKRGISFPKRARPGLKAARRGCSQAPAPISRGANNAADCPR